jgi:hypothetical protein
MMTVRLTANVLPSPTQCHASPCSPTAGNIGWSSLSLNVYELTVLSVCQVHAFVLCCVSLTRRTLTQWLKAVATHFRTWPAEEELPGLGTFGFISPHRVAWVLPGPAWCILLFVCFAPCFLDSATNYPSSFFTFSRFESCTKLFKI